MGAIIHKLIFRDKFQFSRQFRDKNIAFVTVLSIYYGVCHETGLFPGAKVFITIVLD
jgi:hypothetical protein